MINEIDLKDFKDIDCTKARAALGELNYNSDFDGCVSFEYLEDMITKIEALQRKYIKPVAALLRADNG